MAPLGVEQRKQQLAVKLEEPFRVWFLPSEHLERGRFQYEMRVVGTGLTGTPISGLLEVGQLQVERSAQNQKEPIPLFAEPGQVAEGRFDLKLKGGVNATEAVYVQGLDADEPEICVVVPLGKTEPKHKLELRGPTPAKPVRLMTGTSEAVDIPIQLLVPEDMPVGEFEGVFAVAGEGITTAQMPIRLLVDQLQLQLPVDGPSGRRWTTLKDSPERFVQFADRKGSREIRVARATGLPLRPEDLDSTMQGPYANDIGDVQPELPTVSGSVADPNGGDDPETGLPHGHQL